MGVPGGQCYYFIACVGFSFVPPVIEAILLFMATIDVEDEKWTRFESELDVI
jgi:hypothetical protein